MQNTDFKYIYKYYSINFVESCSGNLYSITFPESCLFNGYWEFSLNKNLFELLRWVIDNG